MQSRLVEGRENEENFTMCCGTAAAGGSSRKNNYEQPRRTRVTGREKALHLRKQYLSVHAGDSFSDLPSLQDV